VTAPFRFRRHASLRARDAIVCAVLATLLAAFAPRTAAAQALYLDWNDCPWGGASAGDLTRACLNTDLETLVLSFDLGASMDSVIALDLTVDIESSVAAVPLWWQYAPGECRYRKLIASSDFTGLHACADFWAGQASLDAPPTYVTGVGPGGASQSRIQWSIAVPSNAPRALFAGTRYYAARLVIHNDADGICDGCDRPACLVLQRIRLWRIRGNTTESLDIVPAPGTAHRATWQGPGANCDAVPVRHATWGQLKALYR